MNTLQFSVGLRKPIFPGIALYLSYPVNCLRLMGQSEVPALGYVRKIGDFSLHDNEEDSSVSTK